mmetsp:Transcript_8830/g.16879  ORF Transcript_8830/g.16879 Transcript_8830/m.16879 type:complete len:749 (+) Transcript_8830:64-2310(+)
MMAARSARLYEALEPEAQASMLQQTSQRHSVRIHVLVALACLLAATCGILRSRSFEQPLPWRTPGLLAEQRMQVPNDLLAAYQACDLLFTDDFTHVQHLPEVGNGFIATVINAQFVHVAGVFNGAAVGKGISHRAAIPAPLRLQVAARVDSGALDLRHAAYLRRYSGGAQLRFYAHRKRKSLLVAELTGSHQSILHGFGGSEPRSKDFRWTSKRLNVAGKTVILWSGETLTPELPSGKTVKVSVALPDGPDSGIVAQRGSCCRVVYVAAVRTSLEVDDPDAAAVGDWRKVAVLEDVDVLFEEHAAAWAELWRSGFEVAGRRDVAQAVNASIYYLLSSLREDTVHSLSPGGLASNAYNGHTFWDTETWMFPPLLLWHPRMAASLLQYRIDRIDAARRKAQSYGKNYRGLMFPWESAATGEETCPKWARTGKLEQHITADIALAVQQHWRVTRNKTFLGLAYPGLVKGSADFWTSRVDLDTSGVAHIRKVVPPDEYHVGDDSAYTNYVAKRNLIFADQAAHLLQRTASPQWRSIAEKLHIPYDRSNNVHPEYVGYAGQKIRQADVVLLGFPLDMQMPPATRQADLNYYASRTDANGPAMTWAMHAVGCLELGDKQAASVNFNRSFSNAQPPFKVWTELPSGGGAVNFLTGMGGFLQAAVFGLPGLRIHEDHIELNPSFVDGMESIKVRGIHYRGSVFNFEYDARSMSVHVHAGVVLLSPIEHPGATKRLTAGTMTSLARGKATLRVGQES